MLESLLSILWGTYPEVELLDYMVILCFILEQIPTIFHSGCTIRCSHQQCTIVHDFKGYTFFVSRIYLAASFLKPITLLVYKV